MLFRAFWKQIGTQKIKVKIGSLLSDASFLPWQQVGPGSPLSQTVCPSVAEWLYSSPVFLFANNREPVVMQHSSEKKAEKLMKGEEMQE